MLYSGSTARQIGNVLGVSHTTITRAIKRNRIVKVPNPKNANASLFEDKIVVNFNGKEIEMKFEDISTVSCVDRNKLNIYYKDDVYQFKGDKRFNPLKYMHFYYKKIHEIKGEENDKFLGL